MHAKIQYNFVDSRLITVNVLKMFYLNLFQMLDLRIRKGHIRLCSRTNVILL